VRHYRRALALDPRLAAAHNGLGSALGAQGRLPDAVRQFRAALRVQPDYDEAHNNLGLALRMMGEREKALAHFQAALARRPDWTAPMSEIAWIRATHPDAAVRDPPEAVRLAERAAELTAHRQPLILDVLAASYAAAGDFGRAVPTAQAAMALAASQGPGGLAAEIGKRLELYRQNRPFRETGAAPVR
jgi:tetratricopeptide (TPR) repeat protein